LSNVIKNMIKLNKKINLKTPIYNSDIYLGSTLQSLWIWDNMLLPSLPLEKKYLVAGPTLVISGKIMIITSLAIGPHMVVI
jgi:hypothetical protein